MLYEVVRAKKPTAGSLDGWGWRELKALPVAWFAPALTQMFGLTVVWFVINSLMCAAVGRGFLHSLLALVGFIDLGAFGVASTRFEFGFGEVQVIFLSS